MANALFVAYRNGILGAYATPIDLDGDTLKVAFVDHADDTPNVTLDDFLDDILNAARAPASQGGPSLALKTIGVVGNGVFDAQDTVFPALTGDQSESLVLYKATGTDSTSPLIGFWDTAAGLPLTPNGADVTVTWSASGIIILN